MTKKRRRLTTLPHATVARITRQRVRDAGPRTTDERQYHAALAQVLALKMNMPPREPTKYPTTPIVDTSAKFPRLLLRALRAFRCDGPWRGTLAQRRAKFHALHERLCDIFDKRVRLVLAIGATEAKRGDGCFQPPPTNVPRGFLLRTFPDCADGTVLLHGKLSVVTLLHEWAHVLFGSDEHTAVCWSLSLYARIWPKTAAKSLKHHDGHIVGVSVGKTKKKRPKRRTRRKHECDDDAGTNC